MKKTFFTILFLTILLNLKAQDIKSILIDPPLNYRTYSVSEVPPKFPGDSDGLFNFIAKKLRYPKDARKNKIEGRVIVSFVVEKDGSLNDLKVVRSIYKSLDNEALRVLSISPKWHPGTQGGKPVRCQYTVPISFSLKNKD